MDIRPGGSVTFPELGIEVSLIAKSGRSARLCVTSPRDIKISRKEPADGVAHDTKHEMMQRHRGT
jgi:sRNA-binding carbon storage regulator CsrA